MKVAVIANVSVNGKILLAENPNHQIAQEAMAIFAQVVLKTGNIVLGRKTFEIFEQFPGGVKGMFAGAEIVLLSSGNIETDLKVAKSPEEVIEYLSEKGFSEVAVGGGVETDNAFFDKDLVTDIYFNINPIFVGDGGILGNNVEVVTKYLLAEQSVIADNIMQIHLVKA